MDPKLQDAVWGALVADAVAMPVHWYYDRTALDRDYPELHPYAAPQNPHPGSILWRSKYVARNPKGEILHDQAKYWGQREVHYHQFLRAGDSTVNFRLGIELYRLVVRGGGYSPQAWLDRYLSLMRTPGWHDDTYLEEYHRAFFDNLARGREPDQCGIADIHIGGLVTVPFLVAALDAVQDPDIEGWVDQVRTHVALTHRAPATLDAAEVLTRILFDLSKGETLHEAIGWHASGWASPEALGAWSERDDRTVVGRHLTPACYLPESFTASLFLAWKYADDFASGVLANARCGGDNCHRGAVVGALLGVNNGVPEDFLRNLVSLERLRCDLPGKA